MAGKNCSDSSEKRIGVTAFGHFNAAGIDEHKALPAPFGLGVQAVAGGAGFFGDNGQPPADNAIEEG
jgi:hypothetical protein